MDAFLSFKIQSGHRIKTSMIGFLIGIAVHSFFPLVVIPINYLWLMVGLIVVLFIFIKHSNLSGLFAVFILSIICGVLRFDFSVPRLDVLSGLQSSHFEASVQSNQSGQYGRQSLVNIRQPFKDNKISILARLSVIDSPPIGSRIFFSCNLKLYPKKSSETQTAYAARLKQAQMYCSPTKIIIIQSPAWWDVREQLALLRQNITRRISANLPGDDGILIAGMLYGERGMSAAAQEAFRRAGLTHLIAVSGSNFSIIVTLVSSILLGLGINRKQSFKLTTLIMVIFVAFVGFSSSVLRAAVMGWVVLLSRRVGRLPRIWHVITLSACILCLLDPWVLAYDVGFALSFLATIGLIIWTKYFDKLLFFLPTLGGVREAAATTFSATLMTLPYMAFYFERMSLAGLLTNCLAVPIVPWTMLFGFISAIWGHLAGWQIVSLPAQGSARIIFLASRIVDFVPWLDIHIHGMNLLYMLVTYIFIAICWLCVAKKNVYPQVKSLFVKR